MEIPEQREEELEEPSDGVDAVQGLDALSELGRRVSRGAERLAEVRGGDEGDQEEGRWVANLAIRDYDYDGNNGGGCGVDMEDNDEINNKDV